MLKGFDSDFPPGTQILTADEMMIAQVNAYNDQPGTLGFMDCPICKNKGNVMKIYREGNYTEQRLTRCNCMDKRIALQKANMSGLGKYLKKGYNDFKTTQPFQQRLMDKAQQYVNSDLTNWFIVLGQVGCGKTLLCSIISNQLLNQGHDVLYVTWTDFIGQLKRDIMDDEKRSEVSRYLNKVKTSKVLFIDELLKKYNETDLKYVVEIINYRYCNDLPTIITSEKHINQLLDIDEATFSRVVEKSGKYFTDVNTDRTKNYRLRNL